MSLLFSAWRFVGILMMGKGYGLMGIGLWLDVVLSPAVSLRQYQSGFITKKWILLFDHVLLLGVVRYPHHKHDSREVS